MSEAPKPLPPLFGLGFTEYEQADVKKNAWGIIAQAIIAGIDLTAADVVECIQNNDANAMRLSDVRGRKIIFVYSWSLESLRQITSNFTQGIDGDTTIVVVTGVCDPSGITRWTFDVGVFAGRVICYYLGNDLAFPVDVPCKGGTFLDFDENFDPSSLEMGSRVNISLKSLAKSVPWYLGWLMGGTKIDNHTHVMNHPKLLAQLLKLVKP